MTRIFSRMANAAGLGMAVLLTACAAQPTNPSFPLTRAQARAAMDEMRQDPRPLRRPLVIIGGFLDPDVSPPLYARLFRGLTGKGTIIPVSIGLCGSVDECRRNVIEAVDKACPSTDPIWTTEVDVIGASLGGLIGRYAAALSMDSAHPRRLRIGSLFTISSPHSGSTLAQAVGFTQFHRDIRPGSDFLKWVAASDSSATYTLYPYVHLNDEIVGEKNAAPPGVTPYWLDNPHALVLLGGHGMAMIDPRIQADIARHLRGEAPFIRTPPAPLPEPGAGGS